MIIFALVVMKSNADLYWTAYPVCNDAKHYIFCVCDCYRLSWNVMLRRWRLLFERYEPRAVKIRAKRLSPFHPWYSRIMKLCSLTLSRGVNWGYGCVKWDVRCTLWIEVVFTGLRQACTWKTRLHNMRLHQEIWVVTGLGLLSDEIWGCCRSGVVVLGNLGLFQVWGCCPMKSGVVAGQYSWY